MHSATHSTPPSSAPRASAAVQPHAPSTVPVPPYVSSAASVPLHVSSEAPVPPPAASAVPPSLAAAPPGPSSITRTVVHLRKDRGKPFQPAKFGKCLLEYFGIHDDFGRVECYIEDNIVYLQPAASSSQGKPRNTHTDHRNSQPMGFRFQHPPFCVAHKIKPEEKEALPPEILERGVDVGVCILLEAAERCLLMTRRAQHMRTFPGVWVPPGGHVEKGETLEEAGLREVMEETGLHVILKKAEAENEISAPKENPRSSFMLEEGCRVLGLWESLYPPVLYMGLPQRHHLVVYLHLKAPLMTSDLQRRLKLNNEEVDASLWLTQEMAEVVVYGSSRPASRDIPITLVNTGGEHAQGILNPKALRKKMPEPGFEVERLTTGTRYALKLWLQELYVRNEKRGEQVTCFTIQGSKRGRPPSLPSGRLQGKKSNPRRIYTSEAPTTTTAPLTIEPHVATAGCGSS
nr:nucleoside diphosphate-linked moiety X motif 17-like [Cherax quadricarinatus]